MEAVPFLDDLVREYLLFRGYVKTYVCFNGELSSDRTRFPAEEPIAEALLSLVRQLDYKGFVELWDTLDSRFFRHLPQSFMETVHLLLNSLKKAFLVKAVKTGRRNKLNELLEKFAEENDVSAKSSKASEWDQWYALSFVRDPASHPLFEGFFSKRWFHTLSISLRNFLSTVLDSLPLPKMLAFNQQRLERKANLQEMRSLKAQVNALKKELLLREDQLATLRQNGYRVFRPGQPNEQQVEEPKSLSGEDSSVSLGVTGSSLRGKPSRSKQSHQDTSSGVAFDRTLSDDVASQDATKTSSTTKNFDSSVPFVVTHQMVLLGHTAPVTKVRFSNDGSTVATSGKDGSVRLWDAAAFLGNRPLSGAKSLNKGLSESEVDSEDELDTSLSRRQRSYSSFQMRELEKRLKEEEDEHEVQLPQRSREEAREDASLGPKRTQISTKRPSGSFLPSTTNEIVVNSCLSSVQCSSEVMSLCWNESNDSMLLFGTAEGKIHIHDVDKQRTLLTLSAPKDCPRVLDVASSPTSPLFVSASTGKYHDTIEGGKGILGCYSMETGRRTVSFHIEAKISQVNKVIFNHNGNMLVTGGADGFVRVFDVDTQKAIMGWPAHEGQVSHVHFSTDETTLISCGLDGIVKEWSVHRIGKVLRSFQLPNAASYRQWPVTRCELAFDSGMEHFIASSSSSEATIYDISTPTPVQLLQGHSGQVHSVDWHPLEHAVVTGSGDHTARLSILVPRTKALAAMA